MRISLLFTIVLATLSLSACKNDAETPKADGAKAESKASGKDESAKANALKLQEVLIGEWSVKDPKVNREEVFEFYKDGTFAQKHANGKSGKGRWAMLGADGFAFMDGDESSENGDRYKVVSLSQDTIKVHPEGDPKDTFVCTRRK